MRNNEKIETLVRLADGDQEVAHIIMSSHSELLEPLCFHCQQSVEKYLKAFLSAQDIEYPYSHDLIALNNTCALVDGTFREISNEATALSVYGVAVRYEETPDISLADAKAAIHAMDTANSFVKERIATMQHQEESQENYDGEQEGQDELPCTERPLT